MSRTRSTRCWMYAPREGRTGPAAGSAMCRSVVRHRGGVHRVIATRRTVRRSTWGTTMAKEGALDELLAEVLSRYDNSPNPRLKEVTTAAIRHLHMFAREVNLTREEWFAGIMFLTACGKISDDVRQEFILLSDTTGVSTLVEMLAYDASASSLTDNTVLGPFHADGSPDREYGESML